MKVTAAAKRLIFRPKRFTTIVMMLIIWAGVASSLFAAISTDMRNKEFLRGQAQTIADSMPINDMRSLNGNDNDLATLSYLNVKKRIEQTRSSNPDIGLAHLLGEREGKVFVYADSEPPDTYNHTPPGQTYAGATPALISAFSGSDKPFIDGPSNDRFGSWLTSYAPVKEPHSGKLLGFVGLRVPASSYYQNLIINALVPLLLAAIPLAGLMRDIKLASKEREISQLKNQFVSIASHELRSPLNGMLWAIQSLMKAPPKDMSIEQLELLRDMYGSAASSLATVNEILDFSIFDRGKADKLQHETVDMITVLREVMKTLKLGASEKQTTLSIVGEWPGAVLTTGDVAALKRSFMNIVSNAIKYSPERGTVSIAYKLQALNHIIAVTDRGIGIPEAEQTKVLEGYYRATNATKTQTHGTGLGLWVTRLIIEQHGGEVWLKSKEAQGTTIFVALPALQTLPAKAPVSAQPKAVTT